MTFEKVKFILRVVLLHPFSGNTSLLAENSVFFERKYPLRR